MNIEDFLSTERYTTKQELMELTNLSERAVRAEISKLKLKRVVLYSSRKKGFKLAKSVSELNTLYEIAQEYNAVQHCIADINARKKVFDKQLRTYIAYLKDIEKLFLT